MQLAQRCTTYKPPKYQKSIIPPHVDNVYHQCALIKYQPFCLKGLWRIVSHHTNPLQRWKYQIEFLKFIFFWHYGIKMTLPLSPQAIWGHDDSYFQRPIILFIPVAIWWIRVLLISQYILVDKVWVSSKTIQISRNLAFYCWTERQMIIHTPHRDMRIYSDHVALWI